MITNFKIEYPKLLERKFPGQFHCNPGKDGHGLLITCSGREGFAYVNEPFKRNEAGNVVYFNINDSESYGDPSAQEVQLLQLHESDADKNPTLWVIKDSSEFLQRIFPWAFPQDWTSPPEINPVAEKKRLQCIYQGLSKRDSETPCTFPIWTVPLFAF